MKDELGKLKLRVSLFQVIEKWRDAHDDEIGIWWADKTIDQMTDAAFGVLETIQDYEGCAEREGWYKK